MLFLYPLPHLQIFLLCSVLSLIFDGYFYCICLLHIIVNNDILQRVLKSVTKNGTSHCLHSIPHENITFHSVQASRCYGLQLLVWWFSISMLLYRLLFSTKRSRLRTTMMPLSSVQLSTSVLPPPYDTDS